MDPIRKRLVELRDWYADNAGSTADDDHQLGMFEAYQGFAKELDKALADWDAADEIRPREPSDVMRDAAYKAWLRDGHLCGVKEDLAKGYSTMWDACKQEHGD